ncbi:hypothetical protein F4782DRAFT_389254 [Xylaria castorea]|nr:hypothetical protein F4782DRAFT_389254 [Xylaria castorea]
MPMLKRPWEKYEPFVGPSLPNRTWPSKTIKCAPRWLATDLRDGNQSLESPMTTSQKMAYFKMLVDLGYKEIEVSIPTASATEYNFTRQLIETAGAVPDDVWLQVLCPCRLDLIQSTVKSLEGAKKAIISLYFASSPVWLDTVFGMSQQDVYERVVEAVEYMKSITKNDISQNGTTWNLMFSPEAFSGSEMSFCLRLCEAVKGIWAPTVETPIILNLPATVEMSTPNVYADQVEIFSTSISERQKVCVSLHVHNDRGCSVAAAELGLLAGGERIEGCLFGNGERAGNVDLVILALNLYSQGIDPRVDYSNISSVREVVETSIKIKVHPRAPYSGELFFTAYSGAHQDGIHKGLAKFKAGSDDHRRLWKVPYLSIDPEDLGFSQADIIRLNSQSGKSGVGWTLLHELHVELPKGLQHHFSKIIKRVSEAIGGTISPSNVVGIFLEHYFILEPDERILSAELTPVHESELQNGKRLAISHVEGNTLWNVNAVISVEGIQQRLENRGPNVIEALSNALNTASLGLGDVKFNVTKYTVNPPHKDLKTLVAVECQSEGYITSGWGVRSFNGTDHCELMAALSAALVQSLKALSLTRR